MTSPSSKSPVWHPFTQHATAPAPIEIAHAEGAYLETKEGRRIFDAVSSWWVVTHGHRHPKIMAAIAAQAAKLDQVIFAGFTHEPAERLARQLVKIAPKGLDYVFFSDSGSTAVEVAIKMALGTWRNRGVNRTRIIAMEHAYHGDTIGTMSAGARGIFNSSYAPLLFDVGRIPFPSPGQEEACFAALDAACASSDAAAFVVEPLVLGAGGMLMYGPDVLAELHRICTRYGVLFIADEVMTGWGRTGTLFACDQAGIAPNILCLSKGLTGGTLPLAATLATEEIFDAHYSQDRSKMFFHSSSYTANPIACAAASANLSIWESEPVLNRIASLTALLTAHVSQARNHAKLSNVRQRGTIAAVDVIASDPGYLAMIGPKIYAAALERGVLLRPLGNTIYVMPPYCTTAKDLDEVFSTLNEIILTV